MKKHKLKPRYIFLIVSLAVLIVGYFIYAVNVGGSYRISETIGGYEFDTSEIKVKCSDDSIITVKNVSENIREDGMNVINIDTESKNAGETTLSFSYPSDDNSEIITIDRKLFVLPFGTIYDTTFNSFTAINAALILEIAALLLLLIVLSISFVEKIRQGNYSYAMAVLGGVILFILLTLITTLTDEYFWSELSSSINVDSLAYVFLISGNKFVSITTIPVILLAVALAISNVWLALKEGFRLQNALGILVGVLIMGALFVIHLSNKYNGAGSIISYYALMIIHMSSTFLLCYFECMLISVMFCAAACTRYKPAMNMDYIIILGCAIRSDGTPTPLLKGRVQRAFDFEAEQYKATGKHSKFVPSGGQGSDEIISEAESMKRCLMEMGVPEDRIVREDKSVNTYQNMAFSKMLIEQDAGNTEDISIGFSTTNYHVFRGYTLAKKLGFKVKGLSAKTKLYFFPNAFVREFIGLLWEQKLRHIIAVSLIILFAVSMYITMTN